MFLRNKVGVTRVVEAALEGVGKLCHLSWNCYLQGRGMTGRTQPAKDGNPPGETPEVCGSGVGNSFQEAQAIFASDTSVPEHITLESISDRIWLCSVCRHLV